MPQFLVAIHRPNGYDPSQEDAAMGQAIDALNDAMVQAGVRVFVGGLQPLATARTIRRQSDGSLVESQGPCFQTDAHVGGFWVLEVADQAAALAWGQQAATACQADVEVRPFH